MSTLRNARVTGVRFCAWPFGGKGSKPLSTAADVSAVAQQVLARRQTDSARVLYVGLTRSVSVTCLAAAKPAPAALNTLAPGPIVEWAEGACNDGTLVVQGRDGECRLSVEAFSSPAGERVPDVDLGDALDGYTPRSEVEPAEIPGVSTGSTDSTGG